MEEPKLRIPRKSGRRLLVFVESGQDQRMYERKAVAYARPRQQLETATLRPREAIQSVWYMATDFRDAGQGHRLLQAW